MINFDERLKKLKERRQGTREQVILESYDSTTRNIVIASGIDIRPKEVFETLKESPGVKYTIGAMNAVDDKSTAVSFKEGNRVADSIISSLNTQNIHAEKRMQGSVPLDIHIKGHSDVDMLIILKSPLHTEKPYVFPDDYVSCNDPRSMEDIIKELRLKVEKILPNNFPVADVNISGNKSISIDGGSLSRKVDIVPSCWYDTINFQKLKQEHHRGVKIYHKNDHKLDLNYPFTHIKIINERDTIYLGNLKCVIRLLKNMIADMPDYKKQVVKKLSSYDLAAIAYHMNETLQLPIYMRLGLVEKTRSHLVFLESNQYYRNSLYVPDGTRKIFDEEEKVESLQILTKEINDLSVAIFKELSPYLQTYTPSVILNKVVYT